MAEPFVTRDKPGRTLAQRVLRRPNSRDALTDVNNLLASAPAVDAVTEEQIASIASEYRINLHAKLREEFGTLYREYVEHCLADKRLSEDEFAALRHLKQLLGLSDPDADRLFREIAQERYRDAVSETLEDGRVTSDERALLDSIQENLQLPPGITDHIYKEAATSTLQRSIDRAISDDRLSPEEDTELQAMAANLGVRIESNEDTRRALERMRLYWTIENGDIPPIPVDINLPRTETCYLYVPEIDWYEHRTVSRRINYSGPTARVRIAKGIYWRAGSVKAQSVSEEELRRLDSGPLYLTNKRLIFMGARGNKNIRLNKILTFEAFSNGLDVQKDTGRSPFLAFDDDVDLASLILDRTIRDANS